MIMGWMFSGESGRGFASLFAWVEYNIEWADWLHPMMGCIIVIFYCFKRRK